MDKEKLKALIDRDLKEGRLPFIYAAEIERLLAENEELRKRNSGLAKRLELHACFDHYEVIPEECPHCQIEELKREFEQWDKASVVRLIDRAEAAEARADALLAEIEILRTKNKAFSGANDYLKEELDALQKERDDLAAWAEQITKYLRLIEQEDRHDMSGRSNFRSYVERIYKKALSLPIPGSAERMREEVRREDVQAFVRKYASQWRDKDDSYWLARLMQEVGELASSLVGDHEDLPEHELCQIASIAENWLNKRAACEKGEE